MLLRGKSIHHNNPIPTDRRATSPNTLVLLVSYVSAAGEEDPGAMVVDRFSFGPRRVYAIARLVARGDSWGVDGVIVVPYVAVSIFCAVRLSPVLISFPVFGIYTSRMLLLPLHTHT